MLIPTLGVEEGEASRDSTEDPDFLLRTFRTEVERGGAGGGIPSGGAPPPTLPLTEGIDVWEVILITPVHQKHNEGICM